MRSNTGLALLSAGLQGASTGMNWSSSMSEAGYTWGGWTPTGGNPAGYYKPPVK